MIFFRKVQPPAFAPGGALPPKEKVPNWTRIAVAIALLIAIVVAAFYARHIQWDSAADRLLDLAKVGGGMLFGVLLGEKTASD